MKKGLFTLYLVFAVFTSIMVSLQTALAQETPTATPTTVPTSTPAPTQSPLYVHKSFTQYVDGYKGNFFIQLDPSHPTWHISYAPNLYIPMPLDGRHIDKLGIPTEGEVFGPILIGFENINIEDTEVIYKAILNLTLLFDKDSQAQINSTRQYKISIITKKVNWNHSIQVDNDSSHLTTYTHADVPSLPWAMPGAIGQEDSSGSGITLTTDRSFPQTISIDISSLVTQWRKMDLGIPLVFHIDNTNNSYVRWDRHPYLVTPDAQQANMRPQLEIWSESATALPTSEPHIICGNNAATENLPRLSTCKIFDSIGNQLKYIDARPNQKVEVHPHVANLRNSVDNYMEAIVIGCGPHLAPQDHKTYLGKIGILNRSNTNLRPDWFGPFAKQNGWSQIDANPTNEVRITVGNILGDAFDEIIAAQGSAASSRLCLIPYINKFVSGSLHRFRALNLLNPPGGVQITTADIDHDGYDEIIVGQMGEPENTASYHFGSLIQAINFSKPWLVLPGIQTIPPEIIQRGKTFATFGESSNPSSAIRLAGGDVDGDGRDEIVVVSAQLNVYNGTELQYSINGGNKFCIMEAEFNDDDFLNGRFSVAKDAEGNNVSFALFSETSNPSGDIRVAVANIDDTPEEEIIIGRGPGARSEVLIYRFDPTKVRGKTLQLLSRFQAFTEEENPAGGVNVAAFPFRE